MVNWFTVRSPQDCGYTSWYKDQRSRRVRVVLTVLNMISFACYSIFFALSVPSAWSNLPESIAPSNGGIELPLSRRDPSGVAVGVSSVVTG